MEVKCYKTSEFYEKENYPTKKDIRKLKELLNDFGIYAMIPVNFKTRTEMNRWKNKIIDDFFEGKVDNYGYKKYF